MGVLGLLPGNIFAKICSQTAGIHPFQEISATFTLIFIYSGSEEASTSIRTDTSKLLGFIDTQKQEHAKVGSLGVAHPPLFAEAIGKSLHNNNSVSVFW